MHSFDFLKDLVIVLGAAVLVVTALRRARIPSIAGFILTGALAGPGAFRLIDDTAEVRALAEVGVIMLLFGVGLELSPERIRRLWKVVLLGGGIQVAATIACTAALSSWLGLEPGAALFMGCVVAVSSTAVVLRGLSERGELESPHGRLAVGVLVFQDLCVVPMILAVPFMSGKGGSAGEILAATGIAILILGGVLLSARILVPRLLNLVARTRQRELFVLTVFFICFGIAWTVSLAGVSLALGAFLAGLVVSGSEFRHQALSDLLPARELLASIFFVSVGMLLDLSGVLEHVIPMLGLLAAILAGKFLIILATVQLLRLPLRVAILSAAVLCQVGEFSFVLLSAAEEPEILGSTLSHNLLVAIILSMLLAPVAIALGPHLASSAARIPWLNRLLGAEPPGVEQGEPQGDHAIVAGYGMAGQALCKALREAGVPYLAVDLNPDNVRAARANGHRAVLGDITQAAMQEELGCARARLVVISINDARATRLALLKLREAAPDLPLIVRAQFEVDREFLSKAGATLVVTAEATAADVVVTAAMEALQQS